MTDSSAVTLLLVLLASSSCTALAASDDETQAIQRCRAIVAADTRLACYDRVARRFEPPTFAGRLSLTTKEFTIDQPYRLRYHSKGVIFVLYLKDSNGEVLKNLNVAGGGSGAYIIADPGTYFLQINGSAKWKIWLEPTTQPIHADTDHLPTKTRMEP